MLKNKWILLVYKDDKILYILRQCRSLSNCLVNTSVSLLLQFFYTCTKVLSNCGVPVTAAILNNSPLIIRGIFSIFVKNKFQMTPKLSKLTVNFQLCANTKITSSPSEYRMLKLWRILSIYIFLVRKIVICKNRYPKSYKKKTL